MIAVIRLRKEPAYRRDAFVNGLKKIGYTCVTGENSDDWYPNGPDDLLVLWNKKAGLEEKMADAWEAQGGTVIVTENAYLQKVDKSMYAISTHGHNGSGWFPENDEDRFSKLGFELKEWQPNRRGPILFCGQRHIGSMLMASPVQWGEKAFKDRVSRGEPSKFRPHPGNFAPKTPLVNDLADARVCAIWSSSSGVVALVEGVPVWYFAPHWICQNAVDEASRSTDLEHMAHGQWTVAEIESGEPFARMRAENWGPRWR